MMNQAVSLSWVAKAPGQRIEAFKEASAGAGRRRLMTGCDNSGKCSVRCPNKEVKRVVAMMMWLE